MRPLDPRLLRYARKAAAWIAVLAALGVVTAACVIGQAQLLAAAIAGAVTDSSALPAAIIAALAAVIAVRAAAAWAAEAAAHRASAAGTSELRRRLLTAIVTLGPSWQRTRRTAELTELATTGIDSMDGYFTSYLPKLILAVAVPLAVLVQIAVADPVSGAVVAVTLPLVPLFGALIGMATSRHARRRWQALAQLAHHFLDVVSGLTTLQVFGRAKAQRETIERVTGEYRRATMATLRLAFLSGLALELIAMMSVALVATEIGLRLAYGHLGLRTGLLVLVLAPEAYLPLRAVGAQFHATADGLAAAEEVFAVLETPTPPEPPALAAPPAPSAPPVPHSLPALPEPSAPSARREVSGPFTSTCEGGGPLTSNASPQPVITARSGGAPGVICIEAVTVRHDGRSDPAPHGATLTIVPGRITVLAGPSGCGKSTLLSVLLGFTRPDSGTVSPRCPREAIAWLPQDPVLFAGTVAANIALAAPAAPAAAIERAAREAALGGVPLDRTLGERGAGLSAGQRRRVALARALLARRPVLLLDEPTAGLDEGTEQRILATLREQARAGRALLVVSHHPAVLAAADEIVTIGATATAKVPA
jgi:ATP-binding cassette subfamily C protein CydCD